MSGAHLSLPAAPLSLPGAYSYAGAVPRATRLTVLDALFALALASLFVDVSYDAGFAKVRPFDLLTALSTLMTLMRVGPSLLTIRKVLLFPLLFLAVHVMSAFLVEPVNGAREGLQAAVILAFVMSLLAYYRRRDISRMMSAFAVLLLAVVAYTILWHVMRGYYFNWKHLHDAKWAFLVLPAVGSGLLASQASAQHASPLSKSHAVRIHPDRSLFRRTQSLSRRASGLRGELRRPASTLPHLGRSDDRDRVFRHRRRSRRLPLAPDHQHRLADGRIERGVAA
jgi:hypothetical protein